VSSKPVHDADLLEETDDDIATRSGRSVEPGGGVGWKWIFVAVVVGIVIGVTVLGRSLPTTPQNTPAGHPATAGATVTDPAVLQAELEAVVAANPGDIDARLQLGTIYFNNEEFEKARAQWQAVLDIAPDTVMAHYNMGWYFFDRDAPDCAAGQAEWGKVLELGPNSDEASIIRDHMDQVVAACQANMPTTES